MRLLRNSSGPIAIDCGSYALRVLQLGGRDDHPELVGTSCHVFSSDAAGAEDRRTETLDALHAIAKCKDFRGKQTISALGEKDLQIRNIRLPELPAEEQAPAVRFAALDRIAGLDEDAEIRSLSAGTVVSEEESQQEIIVLAAKASVVRDHLDLLSKVGFESAGIDAAPLAMFRPFERYLRRAEDREQVNVFVDVGWSGTRIVISRGDRVVFARTLGVGGAAFNRLVAGRLSLGLDEAAEVRGRIDAMHASSEQPASALDQSTMESVDAAVQPAWQKLGKEIGLCLRYYAVTFRGARAEGITVVGGESMNERRLDVLSEVTGLNCRVGFPLRNVANTDMLPGSPEGRPLAEWATVAGLSMSRFAGTAKEMVA